MKKLLSFVLTISVLLFCCFGHCHAYSYISEETSVIYFENGSYMIIEITVDKTARSTDSKSGQKCLSYYSASDIIQWSATIRGTFSYNGISATCTNSDIVYTIHDSSWKITSATASKSGNKAIGDITAKSYVLGIPVQTVNRTLTLTCSANGTLS